MMENETNLQKVQFNKDKDVLPCESIPEDLDEVALKKRVEAIFLDSDIEEEENIELEVRKRVDELTAQIHQVSLEEELNQVEKESETNIGEAKDVEEIVNEEQDKSLTLILKEEKIETSTPEIEQFKSQTSPPPLAPKPVLIKKNTKYPDELNPFGDEDEEEEINELKVTPKVTITTSKKTYPSGLNPFGDEGEEEEEEEEEEEDEVKKQTTLQIYPKSLNPFGDEEDEEIEEPPKRVTPIPRPRTSRQSTPTPSQQQLHQSSVPSKLSSTKAPSTGAVRTKKKRQAPPPPTPLTMLNTSVGSVSTSDLDRSITSLGDDHSIDSLSSASSSRTPTPLPRRSKVNVTNGGQNGQSPTQPQAMGSTPDPTSAGNESTLSARIRAIKNKKRPAPSIPVIKRAVKSSLPEIEAELNSIGDELPDLERERNELETWLTNNQLPDEKVLSTTMEGMDEEMKAKLEEVASMKSKHQEKLDQLIDVAKRWCELAKKQKELMYMKREHKLEETQAEIEYQLRMIVSKQDAQKTEEDKQKENDLLARMMDIVQERNDIIENMIRDENEEFEKYRKLMIKFMPTQTKIELPETGSANGHDTKLLNDSDSGKSGSHKHGIKLHLPKGLLKIKKKKSGINKSGIENEVANDSVAGVQGIALRNGDDISVQEEATEEGEKKKKKHFTISKSTLKKLTSPISGSNKSKVDFGKGNNNTTTGEQK